MSLSENTRLNLAQQGAAYVAGLRILHQSSTAGVFNMLDEVRSAVSQFPDSKSKDTILAEIDDQKSQVAGYDDPVTGSDWDDVRSTLIDGWNFIEAGATDQLAKLETDPTGVVPAIQEAASVLQWIILAGVVIGGGYLVFRYTR
jgi:hypothetical protein